MNQRIWKTISYETQGLGHIKDNVSCQDKTYSLESDGVSAAALSDGAGSAKFSHFGAETAVKTACEFLCKNFTELVSSNDPREVKERIISAVVTALKSKAEELNAEIKDLACTLLLTGIKDDKFLMFHVGDGVIGYISKGEIKVASAPVNGEFANTTIFVGSSKALQSCKLIKGNSSVLQGVLMMSDGSAESFYSKRENKLVKGAKKIADFSTILQDKIMEKLLENTFETLVKQNTQDDCSITLLTPKNSKEKLERFSSLSRKERYSITRIHQGDKGRKSKLRDYKKIVTALSQFGSSYPHFRLEKFTGLSRRLLIQRVGELTAAGVISMKNGEFRF